MMNQTIDTHTAHISKSETGAFQWLETQDGMEPVRKRVRWYNDDRTIAYTLYTVICGGMVEVTTNLETKRSWISRRYEVKEVK